MSRRVQPRLRGKLADQQRLGQPKACRASRKHAVIAIRIPDVRIRVHLQKVEIVGRAIPFLHRRDAAAAQRE
jgi:hypothetical protein